MSSPRKRRCGRIIAWPLRDRRWFMLYLLQWLIPADGDVPPWSKGYAGGVSVGFP
jgi:hypothetical protein